MRSNCRDSASLPSCGSTPPGNAVSGRGLSLVAHSAASRGPSNTSPWAGPPNDSTRTSGATPTAHDAATRLTAASGTSPLAGMAGTPTTAVGSTGMDKDTFLKLLVAQMKYQDPGNPADTNQLMAQTATFSQVEKLEELAKQNASMLALQRSSSA